MSKKTKELSYRQLSENFINSKSPLENISNIESNFILYNEAKKLDETLLFKDFQKQNLKESPASDIVTTGKITEVEGDNIKIEYKEGEFANKTSDEIIKKIKESEEEENKDKEEVKEEDKKEEEK